jgi:hypothetical protein
MVLVDSVAYKLIRMVRRSVLTWILVASFLGLAGRVEMLGQDAGAAHQPDKPQANHANRGGGVEILDDIPDDAEYSMIGREILDPLIKSVYIAWLPLLPADAKPPVSHPSSSNVTFTIHADGSVTDVTLENVSGSDAISQASKLAIESAKFAAFPADIKRKSLTLRLNFLVNAQSQPKA